MEVDKIQGAHVEFGREQGFVPLWIRFEVTTDTGTGQMYPSMVCQLRPTREEKVKIAMGEPITLRILGVDWPPVSVEVGDKFDQMTADVGVRYFQHIMQQRRAEAAAREAQADLFGEPMRTEAEQAAAHAADLETEQRKATPAPVAGSFEQQ